MGSFPIQRLSLNSFLKYYIILAIFTATKRLNPLKLKIKHGADILDRDLTT